MDAKKYLKSSNVRTKRGYTTIDVNLSAGIVDQVINSPGTLFFLDKLSTGLCFVQGSTDQGTNTDLLLASPGFSMFDEEGFSGFRISAPAQAGKTLRIVIASGMTIKPGDAVSSGSVATNTVDASLARTLNSQAFLGAPICFAAASNNAHVGINNPVSSTKNIYIESMAITSSTATRIDAGFFNGNLSSTGGTPVNKLGLSAYTGAASIRSDSSGTVIKIATSAYIDYVTVNVVTRMTFKEPLLVQPGFSFNVAAQTVNTNLIGNFEWYEQ